MSSRIKSLVLMAVVFAMTDIGLAQVCRWVIPWWDIENIERNYRIPNEQYHHDLKPLSDTLGIWGGSIYPVKTNSLGFKDSDTREVPLQANRPRIVVIGDSFTEGIGLTYEQSYAGQIAKRLADQGIDLLNAGVIGYSPAIYYAKVKHLIEQRGLEFDQLAVFLDISDIPDEAYLYDLDSNGNVKQRDEFPDWGSEWAGGRPVPVQDQIDRYKLFLKTNSVSIRLADMIKDRLFPLPAAAAKPPHLLGGARGEWTTEQYLEDYGRPGLIAAEANLDRLKALLDKHEIKLTLVVYPWPAQIHYDDRDSVQVSYWQDWTDRNGVEFINLFPVFFTEEDSNDLIDRLYLVGDVHFNEPGSLLIAESFMGRIDLRHLLATD